jgi:hypothetical protein
METKTIEYGEKSKYARQVLTDLLGRSIDNRKSGLKRKRDYSFKTALQETMMMSADITQNGIEGYKTLDDLLNED